MGTDGTDKPNESQADKFAELARALECDEDGASFDVKLREVVKYRPEPPDKADD